MGAVAPMRALLLAVALATGASVSGCGGGRDAANIPAAGNPVSTPAPLPPAPAPVAVVAGFPSSSPPTFYGTSHASITALADIKQFPDGTAKMTGLRQVTFVGSPSFGNLEYRGPNQYAVEFYGFGGPAFGPLLSTDSDDVFDRFRGADYGLFANMELARKRSDLPLDHATFGNVIYALDSFNNVEITFFAAGSFTPQSGLPVSGFGTYEGFVDGLWIDGNVTRRLYGSRARLTVNFATGESTYKFELRGYDNAFGNFAETTTTPLASIMGTTNIKRQFFFVELSPTTGYVGSFAGQFLGPSAEEISWSFRLTADSGQVIFGAVAGRR